MARNGKRIGGIVGQKSEILDFGSRSIQYSDALQWHVARLGTGPAGPAAIGEETPLNDETRVNTTLTGSQFWSSSAALANGGFVVVWEDLAADTLRFRRYDAEGNASAEITMPLTTEPGSPIDPVVTGLPDGGFVVAWNSGFNSGTDQDIRAQRFDANGIAVGGPFDLHASNSTVEAGVTIATLASGGFAIAWTGPGVQVRFYDADGVALSVPQAASVTAHSVITQARVAGLEGGGSIVVWAVADVAGNDAPGAILGRRFDASGNPVGGEFEVTPIDGNTDGGVEIVALDGGGFAVAWSSTDPDQTVHILAQRFDASGTPVGDELELHATSPGGTIGQAALSALPGGGFFAAWNESGTNDIIRARAFDADGVPFDEAFTVNQGTDPDVILLESAVSTLADGSIVIAWGDNDIYYRRFAIDPGAVPPIVGTSGPDNLVGTPGDDVIQGLAGDDFINGGGGDDEMSGGDGDDVYIVDSAGDQAIESDGGGSDVVYALGSFALSPGSAVERLSTIDWSFTTAIDLTGNGLTNLLEGNAGVNLLDGGGGADRLIGFGGDDQYRVDDAGDVVVETGGGGTDTVHASVSYQLNVGSDIERLFASDPTGTDAISLIGNEQANMITGNAGANFINGGGGADAMNGLGGDDVYVVDAPGDLVLEAADEGSDIIYALGDHALVAGSHVERLSSIDWTTTNAIDLTGNELANLIEGNAGANVLDGRGGNDVLVGFGGADTFAFTTAPGAGNADLIADFSVADDTISLDDAVFAGLALGALNANAFVTGSAAADADDRIIYNSTTGALFFDADGSGAGTAVQFATLTPGLALTASDFMVI
jgi:Ca2+-binding RTX toxin-like protein